MEDRKTGRMEEWMIGRTGEFGAVRQRPPILPLFQSSTLPLPSMPRCVGKASRFARFALREQSGRRRLHRLSLLAHRTKSLGAMSLVAVPGLVTDSTDYTEWMEDRKDGRMDG
jgi:hypothetical protein